MEIKFKNTDVKNKELIEKINKLEHSKNLETNSIIGVLENSDYYFNEENLIEAYKNFNKTKKENQFKKSELIEINENELTLKKRIKEKNVVYNNFIEKLKKNIQTLKSDNEINSQINSIIGKYHSELWLEFNKLIETYQRLDREYQMNIEKLNSEKTRFFKEGPKGFSKEYFEIFPDVSPDYSSEGVKKPSIKNPKNKGNDFFAPVVTEDEPEKIHDRVVIVGDPNEPASSTSNEGDFGYFGSEPEIVQEPTPPAVQEVLIYDVVDEPAQFPGGQEALKKYIKDNLKFPQTAIDKGIEGKCYLKFIISENGYISNVKVIYGVVDCPECDQEAIRLIKSMPKWKPGKVNGEPVNSTSTLFPIQFKLD